jgi:hypothetical protein
MPAHIWSPKPYSSLPGRSSSAKCSQSSWVLALTSRTKTLRLQYSGMWVSRSLHTPTNKIKVGNAGDTGAVEVSDIVITAQGGSAGAIGIEWNIKASAPGAAGLWDVHVRLGGTIVRTDCTMRFIYSIMLGNEHQCRQLSDNFDGHDQMRVSVPRLPCHKGMSNDGPNQ